MTDIAALETELTRMVDAAADEAALEQVRVAALGKKGSISAMLATLGKMSPEDRKVAGPQINGLKDRVDRAIAARRQVLKSAALEARLNTETVDVTLPTAGNRPTSAAFTGQPGDGGSHGDLRRHGLCGRGRPRHRDGRLQLHQAEFPRRPSGAGDARHVLLPAETGRHGLVLRTHTSPVQVRTMLTQKPPIRVICPGRTYRCDSDQTHTPMFHQVEGLVVDKGSHLGHLKWILAEFCKAFFEVTT